MPSKIRYAWPSACQGGTHPWSRFEPPFHLRPRSGSAFEPSAVPYKALTQSLPRPYWPGFLLKLSASRHRAPVRRRAAYWEAGEASPCLPLNSTCFSLFSHPRQSPSCSGPCGISARLRGSDRAPAFCGSCAWKFARLVCVSSSGRDAPAFRHWGSLWGPGGPQHSRPGGKRHGFSLFGKNPGVSEGWFEKAEVLRREVAACIRRASKKPICLSLRRGLLPAPRRTPRPAQPNPGQYRSSPLPFLVDET